MALLSEEAKRAFFGAGEVNKSRVFLAPIWVADTCDIRSCLIQAHCAWRMIDSLAGAKCASQFPLRPQSVWEDSGVVALFHRTVKHRVHMNMELSRSNEGFPTISTLLMSSVVVVLRMCLSCNCDMKDDHLSPWCCFAEHTERTSADAESNEPLIGHSRTL